MDSELSSELIETLLKDVSKMKKQKKIEALQMGSRIRLAFMLREWTQEEFAQKANIHLEDIDRWLKGLSLPDVLQLRDIAYHTQQPLEFFYMK